MPPRILCVAGGKGGVGKSFVATNLAYLAKGRGLKVLLVDADVDNPFSKTLMEVELDKSLPVETFVPRIDRSKCSLCGACVSKCPENALALIPGKGILVIEDLCSGCAVCSLVCPVGAVLEGRKIEGWISVGRALGIDLIVGELAIGSRKEAIVIQKLINYASRAWEKYEVVVIDSPPGTGAKLYPILSKCEALALVTEPTPLGLNDYRKFLELLDRVSRKPRVAVVINKAGLSKELEESIKSLATDRGYPVIKIPYSDGVPRSMASRHPYVALEKDEVSKALENLLDKLMEFTEVS